MNTIIGSGNKQLRSHLKNADYAQVQGANRSAVAKKAMAGQAKKPSISA
jgi:hypothetical protein